MLWGVSGYVVSTFQQYSSRRSTVFSVCKNVKKIDFFAKNLIFKKSFVLKLFEIADCGLFCWRDLSIGFLIESS